MASKKRATMPSFRDEPLPPDLQAPVLSADAGQDFESNGALFAPGNWPTVETKIFKTKKRWRALDAYAQVTTDANTTVPVFGGGVLSIFVYAVTQVGQVTTRVLVASGRMADPPVGTATQPGSLPQPKWVVAARAEAQYFEVTVQFGAGAGGMPTVPLQITAVASDQAVQAPRGVGEIRFSVSSQVEQIGQNVLANANPPPLMPHLELVGIQGAIKQGVAANSPRFLLLFDDIFPLPVSANPVMIWPMGSNPGDGIFDRDVRYRAARAITIRASSTADVLTNANDVYMVATIR